MPACRVCNRTVRIVQRILKAIGRKMKGTECRKARNVYHHQRTIHDNALKTLKGELLGPRQRSESERKDHEGDTSFSLIGSGTRIRVNATKTTKDRVHTSYMDDVKLSERSRVISDIQWNIRLRK